MLSVITKFQNGELTLPQAWKEYSEKMDAATKQDADQVFDFLIEETKKPIGNDPTRFCGPPTGKYVKRKQ
tara:strand:+ start:91 stop:300 length:210 start_codon:yes stop_codon:yes gene_type:complete